MDVLPISDNVHGMSNPPMVPAALVPAIGVPRQCGHAGVPQQLLRQLLGGGEAPPQPQRCVAALGVEPGVETASAARGGWRPSRSGWKKMEKKKKTERCEVDHIIPDYR